MFNPLQTVIAVITSLLFITGVYLFLAHTESKTFFGEFLHEAVLTKEQLQKKRDEAYERELANEFGDDDF